MEPTFVLAEHYARDVFTPTIMKERLPADVYESLIGSIRTRTNADPKHADVIAQAMCDWAVAQGEPSHTRLLH